MVLLSVAAGCLLWVIPALVVLLFLAEPLCEASPCGFFAYLLAQGGALVAAVTGVIGSLLVIIGLHRSQPASR